MSSLILSLSHITKDSVVELIVREPIISFVEQSRTSEPQILMESDDEQRLNFKQWAIPASLVFLRKPVLSR